MGEPQKKQKRANSDVSAIIGAITNLSDEPKLDSTEHFFQSIAKRVHTLSKIKQSKIQMEIMQLLHTFEFDDEH